jgi:hypothetical protein
VNRRPRILRKGDFADPRSWRTDKGRNVELAPTDDKSRRL